MAKVKSRDNHSMAFSIGIGILISVIISFLLTLGLTSLIINGTLKESGGAFSIFIVRTLSVFIGCLIGGIIYKDKALPLIGVITGVYFIILMIVSIAAFDQSFINFVPTMVSVLLGGILAAVLRLRPKKRSMRKLPKIK